MTITQADIDAARAALDIPPDAATSTCGLEKHFAAHREAAEERAREEGAKAMQEADAINRVARALYECEKQRSDHVDRLLSAAKGQPVKFRMEHWDDVADIYRSDAVAAIAALDPAQIAGGGK